MVLLGVNVAVMTDDPAFITSKFVPEIVTAEVFADEYDHVPVAEVVAMVGETMAKSLSPYVALTFVQVKVGVALLTVRVAMVEAVVKLMESVGVKRAVTTEVPPPATVAVLALKVATVVFADV